jgi:hypothetical protein
MLGRLASVVAKQILSGYQIVSVSLSRGCFSSCQTRSSGLLLILL